MCISGVAEYRGELYPLCEISGSWDGEGDVELVEFAGEWGFVAIWLGQTAEKGVGCWLDEVQDLVLSIVEITDEIQQ